MSNYQEISSRTNPVFKSIKQLASNNKYRSSYQLTLLDGCHLVGEALHAEIPLHTVLVSDRMVNKHDVMEMVKTLPPRCKLFRIPDVLFNQLSTLSQPDGILAVMPYIPLSFSDLHTLTQQSVLVLEGIQDSGNVGTILRSAAAAGIKSVFLSEACAQVWSPKVLRAAMGAHFRLEMYEKLSIEQIQLLLSNFSGQVLATALHSQSHNVYQLNLTQPMAWLFGAEGSGLSSDLLQLATRFVHIPMAAGVESLNVAVAASVCLFEQKRQQDALQ